MKVLVIRTGTANIASVLAGFSRIGAEPVLSENADDVRSFDRVVLPGVGAFGAAYENLDRGGLKEAIIERVSSGKPTISICLGLQLLAEGSEETPGVPGLGLIEGHATRFPASVRVPQLGWNEVVPDPECKILQRGFAYFANSYRLVKRPKNWNAATTNHGGEFVSAVERGAVVGCQFHPELSGAWGLELMKRWLEAKC